MTGWLYVPGAMIVAPLASMTLTGNAIVFVVPSAAVTIGAPSDRVDGTATSVKLSVCAVPPTVIVFVFVVAVS